MVEQTNQTGQKTHTIKTDPDQSTVKIITLGSVITKHLENVMLHRHMQALETDIDIWVKAEGEHTQERRTEILQQIKNAIGCLESTYSRVAQTY